MTFALIIQTNPVASLDPSTKFVTMFCSYLILFTLLMNITKVRFCAKDCFKWCYALNRVY